MCGRLHYGEAAVPGALTKAIPDPGFNCATMGISQVNALLHSRYYFHID